MNLVSIGIISKATKIPVSTIRTWERRYGFPIPERTESGHRRYNPNIIAHLRLIGRALGLGHRASVVVDKEVDEIRELIAATGLTAANPNEPWIEACLNFDSNSLLTLFQHLTMRDGLLSFVINSASVFLNQLGDAWEEGRIESQHEHFGSECLRDFLAQQWRRASKLDQRGKTVVMATLPGERHCLGLYLLASICASHGLRVVFLGSSLPIPDLVASVRDSTASVLCISISAYSTQNLVTNMLDEIEDFIPAEVKIFTGGSGAPQARESSRIIVFNDLGAFASQIKALS